MYRKRRKNSLWETEYCSCKDIQVPTPRTCECYLLWPEGHCTCDYVKNLEMGRLSWFTWVSPKCNQCPKRRDQRESKRQKEEAMGLWQQRFQGNRSSNAGTHQKLAEAKGQISPFGPPEETNPVEALSLGL